MFFLPSSCVSTHSYQWDSDHREYGHTGCCQPSGWTWGHTNASTTVLTPLLSKQYPLILSNLSHPKLNPRPFHSIVNELCSLIVTTVETEVHSNRLQSFADGTQATDSTVQYCHSCNFMLFLKVVSFSQFLIGNPVVELFNYNGKKHHGWYICMILFHFFIVIWYAVLYMLSVQYRISHLLNALHTFHIGILYISFMLVIVLDATTCEKHHYHMYSKVMLVWQYIKINI